MINQLKFPTSLFLLVAWMSTGCTQDESKVTINEKYKDCCGTEAKVIGLPGGNSVYVPNVFTPNGDGINDLFYPIAKDQDTKKFGVSELKIYNMQQFRVKI